MGFDYTTYTGLGEQTLGGHKQNLVLTKTQEKGAVTPQKTDPDLPVSVQESPAEARCESTLACLRSGALNTTVLGVLGHAGISQFEGGPHYPCHSLASGQTKGGNTATHISRKLG